MWPKYCFQSPVGEGEGGGGTQTPEQIAAAAAQTAQDARFSAMEKAQGLMAQAITGFGEALTTITTKLESVNKPTEKGEKGGNEDDPDFETMDRKTFAAYMTSQMKGVLEAGLKPLGERFGALDEKIDGTSLTILIKDFQKDHPDFFEWKDEMRGLLKDSPTLTPARAYVLARTESPDKAVKMDEKYKLGKTSKPNGESGFLSLFPQGGSATKSGAGKMNPKQAAEAAWDEVMSALPR